MTWIFSIRRVWDWKVSIKHFMWKNCYSQPLCVKILFNQKCSLFTFYLQITKPAPAEWRLQMSRRWRGAAWGGTWFSPSSSASCLQRSLGLYGFGLMDEKAPMWVMRFGSTLCDLSPGIVLAMWYRTMSLAFPLTQNEPSRYSATLSEAFPG